jgi:rhamnulose-1-phosphate aldolase/alcohol dehydrogenase
MKCLYNENDAKQFISKYSSIPEEMALRVYTSRLIGRDSNLVLHGGGNTSVKLKIKNIFGDIQDVIFVKGSGRDLSSIEPEGFAGLNLELIQRLRKLENMADEEMENQLLINKQDAKAPAPSVEALLHAFLPHKYIDHAHADSILVLTGQNRAHDLLKDVLGPKIAVLPYVMSGFPLAKDVAALYEANPDVEAVIIMNHGIFTFGENAKTSYELMIDYVHKAESYIRSKMPAEISSKEPEDRGAAVEKINTDASRIAQIIRGVCACRNSEGRLRRFYTEIRQSSDIVSLSLSEKAAGICRSGAITPDHVIHTKNHALYLESLPEGEDELRQAISGAVDLYKKEYNKYFQNHVQKRNTAAAMDPCPRICLVRGIGLIALGFTRKSARIAADIAEHTFRVKIQADAVGGYIPISESHIFDMEYWDLQQKKLHVARTPKLAGQIALVTGGGGAIGFGIADRLLAKGAMVVISDIDTSGLKKVKSILSERHDKSRVESIVCDVTKFESVENTFAEIGKRAGGVDIVIPNAGVAHVAKIEDLEADHFNKVIAVNLMGTFNVIKASIPIFKRQGTGGNIVLISSKNVFDPGAAFGAYSATKAAAHQISKIAALELAEIGVRVNMVNPDAVFENQNISSKLWDLIGPDRMKSRGLDPEGLKEYYRQRNLLKISVLAEHVGNAVVFFAADETPTTGATIPVDGGVPAAFPR